MKKATKDFKYGGLVIRADGLGGAGDNQVFAPAIPLVDSISS